MISSAANSRIKEMVRLVRKASARRERGLFVVEGIRMFREIPAESVCEVYASESFLKEMSPEDRRFLETFRYETVSDAVYQAMSDTATPQGIMASVQMRRDTKEEILDHAGPSPLLIVLESVQDPGNLGTIMRSAEAAGAAAVIADSGTADVYNPKVVRSTMGAVFRLPFLRSESLTETVRSLKERGVRVYAAHLKGSVPYDTCDYCGPTAFMIGNESAGLTDRLTAEADSYIRIPMLGKTESLNAAVAASILAFEAARQRRHQDG